jgi:hypothetical protein
MKLYSNSAQLTGRADPACRFTSGSESDDPAARRSAPGPAGRLDELPYQVELWDESKTSVEQVLAVTAHGSIGYAAYYAATREYPGRHITLRHNNRTIARSIASGH